MLRPLLSLAACFTIAVPLLAQDKPTADQQKAVAGAWRLDPARSDTIGADPLAGLGGGRALGSSGATHAGRGDGGHGRRGAPAVTADSAPSATAPDPVPTRRLDPGMAMVLREMNPGAGLVIAVNDSAITLANAAGEQSAFKTDGRKRQAAQMDGTVIETLAVWKDNVLQVTKGVAGVGSVKREFRPSKDGTTLELKETLDVGSRKVDKKLVFTRK